VLLTESRNARNEQLLVIPTELLTNREWLPGELLSGLDVKGPAGFRYEIADLFSISAHSDLLHHHTLMRMVPGSLQVSGWLSSSTRIASPFPGSPPMHKWNGTINITGRGVCV